MLDRFFAALAGAMAPLLVAMCERIADKKIPDDTVPKFMDGLLDIARDGVDRAVGVVQTSADGIAGSAEVELGQLGSVNRPGFGAHLVIGVQPLVGLCL
ncbi:hypothetical protein MABM_17300 [Mycobacteroides abscessus]|uniref:Bacteriophage protein n=1 Tax=Mycobacteroides abscessus subsp. bolletii 50594 TaxID=1303024 RepID=A0AB33A8L1_9MYCO|nr:hypothetical protein [Mycobacteroides abscessus]AGM28165.1 hypothetical protein MASS_1563 [Mycobacteroides abscessus subsp. bolletii 50594]BBZ81814.1 hypothetical protein MABM_17300 [Mycobacteroides abscessus]